MYNISCMTATAHALVAGAIAVKIGNPLLAIPLAIASHFVMDCIPHWDFGTHWRSRAKHTTGAYAIIDTLVGITVAYFLFSAKMETLPLLATIIAGVLPDWLETPWYIFFANQKKHEPGVKAGFWERVTYGIYKLENQFHTKAEFPFGAATQLATVAFFLLILQ